MGRGSVSGMGFSMFSWAAGMAEAPVDARDLRGASLCSELLASFFRLGSRLVLFARPFGPAVLSMVRCFPEFAVRGDLDCIGGRRGVIQVPELRHDLSVESGEDANSLRRQGLKLMLRCPSSQ